MVAPHERSADLLALYPWLAVLLGPIAGSFLTTLIERLPRGEAFALGRSRCPACGKAIAARHLVPIASWLCLRSKCAHCWAPIGAVYPLVEIAATLIALWAALVVDGWLVWASCGLGWLLLAIAVIDWRHFIIPDGLTLAAAGLGLVVVGVLDLEALPWHGLAAAGAYAAFRLIGFAYVRLRGREGLGEGDAKLIAASGLWVSWMGLPSVVLWACAGAMIVVLARALFGRRLTLTERVPFGAYLALGSWLVWLYGPVVLVRP